jgi:hypothetical protein
MMCEVLADGFGFLRLAVTSQASLRAEIIFLRKQLAFYEERQTQPRQLATARASTGSCDECLNGEIFCSLKEAQIVIKKRRVEYNTKRPHSALGYRPPAPAAGNPYPPLSQSFTAPGCDVDSLIRRGTKTRSGQNC